MIEDNICRRVEVVEIMIVDEYIIIVEELCIGWVLILEGFIGEFEICMEVDVVFVDIEGVKEEDGWMRDNKLFFVFEFKVL